MSYADLTGEGGSPPNEPCIKYEMQRAKLFLQNCGVESGDNLYNHLSELLQRLLTDKPKNAFDIFEEYSKKLKAERFKAPDDNIRDVYIPPEQCEDAKKFMELLQTIANFDDSNKGRSGGGDEGLEENVPNTMTLLFYLEQANIGLPRGEMMLLNLAIRKLIIDNSIENVRFWGKILGSQKNYYVVEAELKTDELNRRLEEKNIPKAELGDNEGTVVESSSNDDKAKATINEKDETEDPGSVEEKEEDDAQFAFSPLSKSIWETLPEIPMEKIGTGLNEKVYFVCYSPGLDDWVELPPVTPQQIVAAREIVRYFTGDLETPMITYPTFPGVEKNYLRAQIARISATTHISPIGYYTFQSGDEEDDREDQVEQNKKIVPGENGVLHENMNYNPLPVKQLVDFPMTNWCHHARYILKQGRTVWWDPNRNKKQKREEQGGDEVNEEKIIGQEKGPSLLTPLSEDAIVYSIVPWSARLSSYIQLDTAIAIVRSNIWPGAYAVTEDKWCANIYIGWGHKYTPYNHNPLSMPPILDQYCTGPEIMEMQDPIPELEESSWKTNLPVADTIIDPATEEEDEESSTTADDETN